MLALTFLRDVLMSVLRMSVSINSIILITTTFLIVVSAYHQDVKKLCLIYLFLFKSKPHHRIYFTLKTSKLGNYWEIFM